MVAAAYAAGTAATRPESSSSGTTTGHSTTPRPVSTNWIRSPPGPEASAPGSEATGARGRGSPRYTRPGLLVEPGHHDARRPRWGLSHRDERWPRRRCVRRHLGTRLEWPLRGGYDFKRDERRNGQWPPDSDVVCGRILPHRQQDVQDPLHGR